jgi:hypothetical protein
LIRPGCRAVFDAPSCPPSPLSGFRPVASGAGSLSQRGLFGAPMCPRVRCKLAYSLRVAERQIVTLHLVPVNALSERWTYWSCRRVQATLDGAAANGSLGVSVLLCRVPTQPLHIPTFSPDARTAVAPDRKNAPPFQRPGAAPHRAREELVFGAVCLHVDRDGVVRAIERLPAALQSD